MDAMKVEADNPQARSMIVQRGKMLLVRVALGALATIAFLWALHLP